MELDVKKNLDFMGMRNFSVVLNGSLMKSRVDFDDESLEHDRPLQGQSPYLVNAGLFYQSPKLGLTVGVLYNRIGKRIVGIGRSDMSVGGSIDNDIPDMYEMPRNALDVVVSKSFGKHWELNSTPRTCSTRRCSSPNSRNSRTEAMWCPASKSPNSSRRDGCSR